VTVLVAVSGMVRLATRVTPRLPYLNRFDGCVATSLLAASPEWVRIGGLAASTASPLDPRFRPICYKAENNAMGQVQTRQRLSILKLIELYSGFPNDRAPPFMLIEN
jgi:hypothetical protein